MHKKVQNSINIEMLIINNYAVKDLVLGRKTASL